MVVSLLGRVSQEKCPCEVVNLFYTTTTTTTAVLVGPGVMKKRDPGFATRTTQSGVYISKGKRHGISV